MEQGPLYDIIPTLNNLLNDDINPHRYASAYEVIADSLDEISEAVDVDPGVILWLRSAAKINRGEGPFSTFIRSYTQEQHRLRNPSSDAPLTEEDIQGASNNIALAVISDIIASDGRIPTLLSIGNDDVGGASEIIGSDRGWSGALLFSLLGTNEFLNSLLLSDPTDSYDVVAAISTTYKAANEIGLTGENAFAILGQVFATLWAMPVQAPATAAAAAYNVHAFLFNAYGVTNAFWEERVRSGLLQDSDDIASLSGRELVNLGGGDDVYRANADGDIIDGSFGTDAVMYSTAATSITVTFQTPTFLSPSVSYTASAMSDADRSEDLLYNVENITGSQFNDTFIIKDLPKYDIPPQSLFDLRQLNGGEGFDSLVISDVSFGSRTAADIALVVGSSMAGFMLNGIESLTFAGEMNDTFQLFDSSFMGGISPTIKNIDMGGDGYFLDDQGGWMRDEIDAQPLSAGIVAHLQDTSAQYVLQNGNVLVNLKSVNAVNGSSHDDILYAPDDGASFRGNFGNDYLYGGNGVDALHGGGGDDHLFGGAGDDILNGGDGSDVLHGDGGDDQFTLVGFGGDVDVAFGGDGNDLFLIDGLARHVIEGNGGNDVYSGSGYLNSHLTFRQGDGHDDVRAVGLSVSFEVDINDLLLIWDAKEVSSDNHYRYMEGDIAVVIKSTGDSVLFHDVYGIWASHISSYVAISPGLTGIDANGVRLDFADLYPNIEVQFGSTAAYDLFG